MALPALFISAVFVYVAVQIIKIGLAFVKYSEMETRVNALVNGALIKSAGERVAVIKFFGPNRTMQYIPYSFMSCRYEAAKPGKQPANQIISQTPISLYIKFLKNLMDDECIILNLQCPDYAVSEAGYDLVAAQGETRGLYIILKNTKLKPIGYVSLNKNHEFTDDDKRILSDLAANLMPLIEGWDDRKAKDGIIYHLFPNKVKLTNMADIRPAAPAVRAAAADKRPERKKVVPAPPAPVWPVPEAIDRAPANPAEVDFTVMGPAAAYTSELPDYAAAAGLTPFDSPTDWAADAWDWVKTNELSDAPASQNPVTREELAGIIYKFFQLVMRL